MINALCLLLLLLHFFLLAIIILVNFLVFTFLLYFLLLLQLSIASFAFFLIYFTACIFFGLVQFIFVFILHSGIVVLQYLQTIITCINSNCILIATNIIIILNNLQIIKMDIDSANFDPKRYVLNMLKQNTIKELIRKNNEIQQEIKVHDHEIQSLVFQNYSKFISSIDTVRQMKDNICMVDEKLKVLDSSMDKISQLALKIDETFKYKRKQIQKLDTVNKDLQKLRNLCDFPNVLKQDLAQYKATHQSKISQSFVQGPKLFSKSIAVYEQCYKTLQNLKQQPLIEPIFKQSVHKIEQVRSILRTRQVQFSKDHQNSDALRVVTKNLLVLSDQQNQVSVERSYFHSWKQRLIFKRKTQKLEQNEKYDKNISLPDLINNSKIPQMNQQFWAEFQRQFSFIFDQIYGKLAANDQIRLLLSNYVRQIFNWAVNNELEEIIQYSSSMKAYVHANHYIAKNLKEALNKISVGKDDALRSKLYIQLSQKLTEKIQKLGINMLNFIFGRLKLSFLDKLTQSKKISNQTTISQSMLKNQYINILGPIKQSFKNNFEPILNDLEHVQSSHEHIFSSDQHYHQAIHDQIESLIKFLSTSVSSTPELLTEQIYSQINKSDKIHKLQKAHIEHAVKQFYDSFEGNGVWFAIVHNFLNFLNNQLAKKIIESAHKRIQVTQSHNYASVFTQIKQRIQTNLYNLVKFYTNKIEKNFKLQNIFSSIKQFIEILNFIFPDSRRNILNKPSFLSEGGSKIHETELMTARKLRVIEKRIIVERNHILTIFIRRLLKITLSLLRSEYNKKREIDTNCSYCVVQVCYEMGNVEEQTQIGAYYQLLLAQTKKDNKSKEDLHRVYMEGRKQLETISH